jgi:hypothetical protein
MEGLRFSALIYPLRYLREEKRHGRRTQCILTHEKKVGAAIWKNLKDLELFNLLFQFN